MHLVVCCVNLNTAYIHVDIAKQFNDLKVVASTNVPSDLGVKTIPFSFSDTGFCQLKRN